MIGMVTIELLVVTEYPFCGALWAVIFIGLAGHGDGSSVSWPRFFPVPTALMRHSTPRSLKPPSPTPDKTSLYRSSLL
jgi:hypothetical protein